MIVVETRALMAGRVIRWYAGYDDYANDRWVAATSRDATEFAREHPMELRAQVAAVHKRISAMGGETADLSDVLTHRMRSDRALVAL